MYHLYSKALSQYLQIQFNKFISWDPQQKVLQHSTSRGYYLGETDVIKTNTILFESNSCLLLKILSGEELRGNSV